MKEYWLHTFSVSSGKDHKVIQKVYSEEEVAKENHLLLGGALNKLQQVE